MIILNVTTSIKCMVWSRGDPKWWGFGHFDVLLQWATLWGRASHNKKCGDVFDKLNHYYWGFVCRIVNLGMIFWWREENGKKSGGEMKWVQMGRWFWYKCCNNEEFWYNEWNCQHEDVESWAGDPSIGVNLKKITIFVTFWKKSREAKRGVSWNVQRGKSFWIPHLPRWRWGREMGYKKPFCARTWLSSQ